MVNRGTVLDMVSSLDYRRDRAGAARSGGGEGPGSGDPRRGDGLLLATCVAGAGQGRPHDRGRGKRAAWRCRQPRRAGTRDLAISNSDDTPCYRSRVPRRDGARSCNRMEGRTTMMCRDCGGMLKVTRAPYRYTETGLPGVVLLGVE